MFLLLVSHPEKKKLISVNKIFKHSWGRLILHNLCIKKILYLERKPHQLLLAFMPFRYPDQIGIWKNYVSFSDGRKTGEPWVKPSEQGREPITNSTVHMTPDPGIKPRSQWWRCALSPQCHPCSLLIQINSFKILGSQYLFRVLGNILVGRYMYMYMYMASARVWIMKLLLNTTKHLHVELEFFSRM